MISTAKRDLARARNVAIIEAQVIHRQRFVLMAEPTTVALFLLSLGVKLGVKKFVDVADDNEALQFLDSVLGNFASDAAKFGTGRGAEFVKRLAAPDADGRPANHDLQRAVRRAQLWATWLACRARQNGLDAPDEWLQQSIAWIKTAQTELDTPNYQPPELANFDELFKLADPLQDKSSQPDLQVFLNALKERTIAEFALSDAAGAADYIRKGWDEDGVHFAWETLLYEVFNESYKTEPRAQAALLKLLLYRRDAQTGAVVELSAAELAKIHAPMQAALDGLGQKLLAKLEEIASKLTEIESKQDEVLTQFVAWRGETNRKLDEILVLLKKPPALKLPSSAFDHTLPVGKRIAGRVRETAMLLEAMRGADKRALAIVAPGGFGKTTLLAKLVLEAADGAGGSRETSIKLFLHLDLRGAVGVSEVFRRVGRWLGQEAQWQDVANDAQRPLAARLGDLWTAAGAACGGGRVWLALDNFESLLDEAHALPDADWRELAASVMRGGHNARLLLTTRYAPRWSESFAELTDELPEITRLLYGGLQDEAECVAYLRGYPQLASEPDADLARFARKVHRLPMALQWLPPYLKKRRGWTVAKLLDEQGDFFADFVNYQHRDSADYLERGLMRLHYEQLQQQTPAAVGVLRLLAHWRRPVPRAALEHLFTENGRLNEINMTALLDDELAALIEWRENPLPVAQNSGDKGQKNLYGLHPIICDNQFFTENRDGDAELSAARACSQRGYEALEKYRYQHGFDLNDCAAALYQILVDAGRAELANDLAGALMNKAVALNSLGRGAEALDFYDRAIETLDKLVKSGRAELANDLATALMNKAVALDSLGRGAEALEFYDRAIETWDKLVKSGRAELANDLARALANRAGAWADAEEWDKSLADYEAAIGWRTALVTQAGRSELLPELVKNYWCRLRAWLKLERWPEAAADAWAAYELNARAQTDASLHSAVKEAAAREFGQAVGLLRQLTATQREQVYAALTPAQAATLGELVTSKEEQ